MEERRIEQERLDLALSAAHMGTWEWDVQTGAVKWDDRTCELFGVNPADFSGRYDDVMSLIHPDDRESLREATEKVLSEGVEYDDEFRVVWPKDGSIHVLRVRFQAGTVIVGVVWDITERRRADLTRARERKLLDMLMAHLPDNIYFKDRNSRFIAVNQAMARWTGLGSSVDLIGKSDHDLFSPEHADAALADEQKIIQTGEPIINLEERETWPDREDTWVSTTKMPLCDDHGRIIGTFGLSRDITERKHAEEQVARITEKLRQHNQALQEDLDMARELQSALLPARFPHFPRGSSEEDSSLHFYHVFQPSMTVSGDFFDVLEISKDKAGLFICDVMGHGVRAALVAATIRALLSELRSVWDQPAALLTRLNLALIDALQHSGTTLFASAFYVVTDLATGKLHYANAGHPRPLRVSHVVSESRSHSSPLNGSRPGPALGLIRNAPYHEDVSDLSAHELLLLFTDGLFEVRSAGGQYYDYRQLAQAVQARRALPPRELCHSLVAEVKAFSATRAFDDDVCLVAMDIDRLNLHGQN